MNSGIYQIKNIVNNKVYIGQAVDVFKRLNEHYWFLTENKHKNKHLQSSWNKYGGQNFEYSVLYQISVEQLDVAEICAIYTFETDIPTKGFNKTTGGEGGRQIDEVRKKMSKPKSEETRRKMSLSQTGKYRSEATKLKMSIAVIGENNPSKNPETRKKLSNSLSKITWQVIRPDGTTDIIKNLNQYCKLNKLDAGKMSLVANSKRNHHKGFKVEKYEVY